LRESSKKKAESVGTEELGYSFGLAGLIAIHIVKEITRMRVMICDAFSMKDAALGTLKRESIF
jgi:hypothetical protein